MNLRVHPLLEVVIGQAAGPHPQFLFWEVGPENMRFFHVPGAAAAGRGPHLENY